MQQFMQNQQNLAQSAASKQQKLQQTLDTYNDQVRQYNRISAKMNALKPNDVNRPQYVNLLMRLEYLIQQNYDGLTSDGVYVPPFNPPPLPGMPPASTLLTPKGPKRVASPTRGSPPSTPRLHPLVSYMNNLTRSEIKQQGFKFANT